MPSLGRRSHQRLAFLQRLLSDYSLLGISGSVSSEDDRVKRCSALGRDLKGCASVVGILVTGGRRAADTDIREGLSDKK